MTYSCFVLSTSFSKYCEY